MPLVDYPSSDEESVTDLPSDADNKSTAVSSSKKRKRNDIEPVTQALPPLPPVFHTLFVTAPRTHPSDDPSLHGGRTRQVPHVEGNWPTHIYLEWWPSRTELELLQTLVDAADVDGQVHSLLRSELGAQLPLHISLSAPLVLKAEQKSEFEEFVQGKIRESGVGSLEATIQRLRWERNYDGTRWFLVLAVDAPANDELNRLLHACNESASEVGLPLLYAKKLDKPTGPSLEKRKISKTVTRKRSDAFHISIAWQLSEPGAKQRVALDHPNVAELGKRALQFEVVKLKMGNMVKDIRLLKKSTAVRDLWTCE